MAAEKIIDTLNRLNATCRPLLIGSFPEMDVEDAVSLVLKYVPDIPNWVQMPGLAAEGMLTQFAPGFPGLTASQTQLFIDSTAAEFDDQVLSFYEDYMAAVESPDANRVSRFELTSREAGGFFALLKRLKATGVAPMAVKGQITGPFTFCTAMKDGNGRAIFYDDLMRDVAVKLIAMKAAWQVRQLGSVGVPVILFIDEPSLAGFGSSEYISISREDVQSILFEVVAAIHNAGGIAGIHVCANTDWSVVTASGAAIINFDAYAFFDRFVLYKKSIVELFNSGRWLAWGVVPTLHASDIEKATVASLVERFYAGVEALSALGIDKRKILAQSILTPSCGIGTLSLDFSRKVLKLLKSVSEIIRKEVHAC